VKSHKQTDRHADCMSTVIF